MDRSCLCLLAGLLSSGTLTGAQETSGAIGSDKKVIIWRSFPGYHDWAERLPFDGSIIVPWVEEGELTWFLFGPKHECLELDEQKQHVQTELEKVQIETGRTGQDAVDLDIIQRSLQDFGRLVEVLPIDDQKELMQLLISEIVVEPWDPETEKVPSEEGAFTTRIRTKHYKVNIKMHQIPDLARHIGDSSESSDNGGLGSPGQATARTCWRDSRFGVRAAQKPRRAQFR